jgi:hypothetical protein
VLFDSALAPGGAAFETTGGFETSSILKEVETMNLPRLKYWFCTLAMVFPCVAPAQEQPVIKITTESLPAATFEIPYSAGLNATGGAPPYTWSVSRGKLPSGLTLNSTSGAISGTPSTSRTPASGSKQVTYFPFPLTFQVQDSNGLTANATLPVQVANRIVIQTTSLPEGTAGVAYSFCLTATGGDLAYNGGLWTLAQGMLPPRVILTQGQGCHGLLRGTPSKAGRFPVQVRVADFRGRAAQASFVLTIAEARRH